MKKGIFTLSLVSVIVMATSALAIEHPDLTQILSDKKVVSSLKNVNISGLEVEAMRCPGCFRIEVKGSTLNKKTHELEHVKVIVSTNHAPESFSELVVVGVSKEDAKDEDQE